MTVERTQRGVGRADRYLALAFGAVVAVLMMAVLFLGRTYSEQLNERNDETLEATTLKMLSAAVTKVGDSGKFHERLLVEEMAATNAAIAYVLVSDASGRIRSHSDSSRNGTQLRGSQLETVSRALAVPSPIFESRESSHGRVRQIAAAYSGGFNDETPGVIILGLSRSAIESQRRSAQWLLGAVVLILTLLAGTAVLVISRLYGRSIRRMADQLDGLLQHTPLLIRIDGSEGEVVASSDAYFQALEKDPGLSDAMHLGDGSVARDWESSDGSRYSLTTFSMASGGPDRAQICTVGLDISKQSKAEEALRDNEERLRTTLDSIGDGVIATDALMRVERMNPLAEELTQWSLADAVGKSVQDVFHTAMVSTEDLDSQAAKEKLLKRRDGSEIRIEYSSSVMLDRAENRIGDVIVFRDVTRRHRDELRLRQAEKEESIGQLAGGVAHDFNNMLTGILGASQLVERELATDHGKRNYEFLSEYIEIIETTATRAAKLTEQLLAFSRRGTATSVAVNVHDLVAETVDLLRTSIDKRIRIETKLEAPKSVIAGDPTQIQMALLNLGVNARDAMTEGGTLTISTSSVHLDASACEARNVQLRAGEYIQIEFRDTGCGMNQEVLNRIFEPYFTTKGVGKGTGLGLASVHGAVRRTKGAITVESSIGKGTTFRILLPLANAVVAVLGKEISGRIASGESRSILVAEDEYAVRLTAVRILESLGYKVLEAANGREAVELVAASADTIDLVLTDMLMPEMNGREAFYEIRRIAPEMPVVAVSGYTRDVDIEQLERDGLAGFVHKPYMHDNLSAAIESALRRRPSAES